ncbi:MAG TPA: response regulator [Rhizomicrobium sp.]|jgi:FixJ family two-component response regulator|nr:response regulator [Rhizomicrobium sp.]
MTGPQPPVYIVDDDEAVRDSLRLLLESSGFSAREFANADLLLNTNIDEMGCLLLDLHMPGISGLELLRLLRARGLKRPVIVISGRRDPVQDAEVLAAGASALLSKPFDDQQLLDLVIRALSA